MDTHHRPAERSGGRPARGTRPEPPAPTWMRPSGAAGMRALILPRLGAAGPADRVRQGPGSGGRSSAHRRMRVFPSGTRASATWANCRRRSVRRRADGPGHELAPDRQPRSGVSVSVSTARSTCAWTPRAARAWPSGWQRPKQQQIAEVIRDYGEERFAVQIAKAIVARRQERGPISTTAELAELVAGAVKTREPGQNPATRTFQALRIFINAELEELQQALEASLDRAATRAGGWR